MLVECIKLTKLNYIFRNQKHNESIDENGETPINLDSESSSVTNIVTGPASLPSVFERSNEAPHLSSNIIEKAPTNATTASTTTLGTRMDSFLIKSSSDLSDTNRRIEPTKFRTDSAFNSLDSLSLQQSFWNSRQQEVMLIYIIMSIVALRIVF